MDDMTTHRAAIKAKEKYFTKLVRFSHKAFIILDTRNGQPTPVLIPMSTILVMPLLENITKNENNFN